MKPTVFQQRDPAPELRVYRDRTVGLLRRYLRLSLATGKTPTVLGPGQQFFRARISSYKMQTFEDIVIFVHDVEKCLARLDPFSQQVIARLVLQEYSLDEAAALLGHSRRSLARLVPYALDCLTEILLEARLLEPFGFQSQNGKIPCQEGEIAPEEICA